MTNVVTVANIQALRTYADAGSGAPAIWVQGYVTAEDGGEGMFVYVSSDTQGQDNGGTVIVASSGARYHRERNLKALNICWFGAQANSSSDSAPALNAALAALPAAGGEIFLPLGTFTFNSEIVYNMSSSEEFVSLSFVGSGADTSILYWPGKTNGITINATQPGHSIHFRDMSITTGQVCGYSGVALSQATPLGILTQQSDITRVNFRGSSPQTQYWGNCIAINGFSDVNYVGCLFVGSFPSANSGNCVNLQGSSNSPYFSLVHNFTGCDFYGGAVGIIYGSYVQGVNVAQSNFGTNIGISLPSGATGQAQLTVTGNQFGCSNGAIQISSPIGGVTVLGNSFYYPNPAAVDYAAILINNTVTLPPFQGISIIGNSFQGTSVNGTNGVGVTVAGLVSPHPSNIYGVVSGNTFVNLRLGVDLTGATLWNVSQNYYSVTTPTQVLPGTGNSVGVATK